MAVGKKPKNRIEFGDFQTPPSLAKSVCDLLVRLGVRPSTILEPTCGVGNISLTAVASFPQASTLIGYEINSDYVDQTRCRASQLHPSRPIDIQQGDFFKTDWNHVLRAIPQPLLVIGNPPWVTVTEQSKIGSDNLPIKQSNEDAT